MRNTKYRSKHKSIEDTDLYQGLVFGPKDAKKSRLLLLAMHGNETCGVEAFFQMLDEDLILPTHFKLHVLLGNPKAYEAGVRSIHRDLNRCLNDSILEELPEYERERASLILSLLKQSKACLDLHSTSSNSDSFTLPADCQISLNLALSMGRPWVLCSLAHQTTEGGTSLDAALVSGIPATAVECGQHEDRASVMVARECIERFLKFDPSKKANREGIRILKCPSSVEVKEGFEFHNDPQAFDFIHYKQLVAKDSTDEITCPYKQGAFLVMPNSSPKIGEDAFYWAVEVDCKV